MKWLLGGGRKLAVVAVVALAAAGVAYATIPSSGAVINGCYEKRTGILRVIDTEAGKTCMSFETPISWNQQGPKGVAGAQGLQGPQGEKGDRGEAGPQGAQGPQGEPGPAGPTGSKGDTGAQGPAGLQGPQGPAGQQGPTGPQGPPGSGATILTAVVDGDGTLLSGNGAIEVGHPATPNLTGWYYVLFNRDVSNCVGLASLRQKFTGDFDHSGEIATSLHGADHRAWVIETFDSGDNLLGDEHPEDRPFTLVLFC